VLATRPPKKHTTLEERQAALRAEAKEAGLTLDIGRSRSEPVKSNSKELAQGATKTLTD
jgi:hypothetical protein